MRKEKPYEKYWLIDNDKGIAVDVRPSDRVVVQFKSTGHKLLFDRDLITVLKHDLTEEEYKRALDFVIVGHLPEIEEKQRANGFKYYERLEKRRKKVQLSDKTYMHIVWMQTTLLNAYSKRKGISLKEALKIFNENQLIEYIYQCHEILSYCAMDSILEELMFFIEKRGEDENVWEHFFSWQY